MFEITDTSTFLEYILPNTVKLSITSDDIGLKSDLKNIQILKITKNSFFYTVLGFVQSYSGELGDNNGFIKLIPGSYKSDKHVNITGTNKTHINCVCVNGSLVKCIREPILYNFFSLDHPVIKHTKNQESNFLKR